MSLLAWLPRRRRPTGERQGAAVLLRYPPAWHLLSWCLLLLPFVGLALVVWRFPPKPDDIVWLAGMAVGFGVSGTYLVVEVTGLSHELQPNGLVRHGAWRPRRFLPWSQVTALRNSALACLTIGIPPGVAPADGGRAAGMLVNVAAVRQRKERRARGNGSTAPRGRVSGSRGRPCPTGRTEPRTRGRGPDYGVC